MLFQFGNAICRVDPSERDWSWKLLEGTRAEGLVLMKFEIEVIG